MKKKMSKMERQRRQEQSRRDNGIARPPMPSPKLAQITPKDDEARFALLPPEEQEIVTKLYAYRFGLLSDFDIQRVASDAMYVSPGLFSEHGINDMDEKRLVYALATSGMFQEFVDDPQQLDEEVDEFSCPPIHVLGLYREAGGSGWVERVIELFEGLEEKILGFEFLCLYTKVGDSFAPYEFRFTYFRLAASGDSAL